jgi:hypothetical protein
MQTREHVLDCIELLTKTGRLPTDARVSALSRRYDAAEATDNRAYEDQLTRRLGHKPTLADYKTELAQSIARLAGVPRTSGPPTLPHSAASDAAVSAAHSGILATLKDPDSAKFDAHDGEAYSLNSNGTLYAVCGAVNARNGFGGYAGEQLWIYVLPENTIYAQETGATAAMASRDCTGDVHGLKPVASRGR